MRLAGMNEETGEVDTTIIPKLSREFKELAGIDITDSTGQIRDTYDILSDMAKVFPTLSKNTRQYMLELSAGKRQANVLEAVLQNWEAVEKATQSALNSHGSATRENEKYLNSINGKLNQLSSSWSQLANNFISSDFVKFVIDSTTGVIKLIDQVGVLNVSMLGLVTTLSLLRAFNKAEWLFSAMKGFMGVTTSVNTLTGALTLLKGALLTNPLFLGALALVGIPLLFDAITTSVGELKKEVESLSSELTNFETEANQLSNKENLTKSEKERLDYLEGQIRAKEKLISLTKQELAEKETGNLYSNAENVNNVNAKNLSGNYGTGLLGDVSQQNAQLLKSTQIIKDLRAEQSKYHEGTKQFEKYSDKIVKEEKKLLQTRENLSSSLETLRGNYHYLEGDMKETVKTVIDLADANVSNSDSMLGFVDNTKELSSSQEKLKVIFERMTTAQKQGGEYIVDYENVAQKLGLTVEEVKGAISDMALEQEKLNKAMSEDNPISPFEEDVAKLTEELNNQVEGVKLLNGAINSLEEGNTLTGESIVKLLNLYPDLREHLELTEKGYRINIDALKDQATASNETAMVVINNEIEATNQTIQSTQDRITAYQTEIQALYQVIEARQKMFGSAQNNPLKGMLGGSDIMQGGFDVFGSIVEQELKGSLDEIIANEQAMLDNLEESKKVLENKKQDLKVLLSEANTKPTSGIKNKKDKKKKDDTQKILDAKIKSIKVYGEELEKEIFVMEEKLKLATSKGDTKTIDELNKKLDSAYAERKTRTHKMAEDLRGLKALYTDATSQAKLMQEIDSMSNEWFVQRNEEQDRYVKGAKERHQEEIQAIDDLLRQLELQKMLHGEESEEYKALEDQRIQYILQQRIIVENEISRLRKEGVDEDSEYMKEYYDQWYNYQNQYFQAMSDKMEKQNEERKKQLEKQQQAYNDLLEMTIDLIKQEAEEKKKSLKAQLEGYEKIINKQKESLKKEKEEDDYKDELSDKEKAVTDLEAKLQAMEFDNSEAGKAKKLELEQQLAEAKKALSKLLNDKEYEMNQEALDKELESYKDHIEDQIDEVDDYLSKDGQLKADAMKRLENLNKDLYDKLKKWNLEYGDGTTETIDKMWTTATEAMQPYLDKNMNLLEVMKEITQELELLANKGASIGITDLPIDTPVNPEQSISQKTIEKMKANSLAWKTASAQDRKRLEEENQKLGKSIGAKYDPTTGRWLKNGLPLYHSGGLVGGKAYTKDMEQLAVLLNGEQVTNETQATTFMKKTLPHLLEGVSGKGIELNIDNLISVDHMDNDTDIKSIVDEAVKQTVKTLNKTMNNKGFFKGIK